MGAAPEFNKGILRGLLSQHWIVQNAKCHRVDAAGITIIKRKKSPFVPLRHLCDEFGIIEVRHNYIVLDYGINLWLKPKDKTI